MMCSGTTVASGLICDNFPMLERINDDTLFLDSPNSVWSFDTSKNYDFENINIPDKRYAEIALRKYQSLIENLRCGCLELEAGFPRYFIQTRALLTVNLTSTVSNKLFGSYTIPRLEEEKNILIKASVGSCLNTSFFQNKKFVKLL